MRLQTFDWDFCGFLKIYFFRLWERGGSAAGGGGNGANPEEPIGFQHWYIYVSTRLNGFSAKRQQQPHAAPLSSSLQSQINGK